MYSPRSINYTPSVTKYGSYINYYVAEDHSVIPTITPRSTQLAINAAWCRGITYAARTGRVWLVSKLPRETLIYNFCGNSMKQKKEGSDLIDANIFSPLCHCEDWYDSSMQVPDCAGQIKCHAFLPQSWIDSTAYSSWSSTSSVTILALTTLYLKIELCVVHGAVVITSTG